MIVHFLWIWKRQKKLIYNRRKKNRQAIVFKYLIRDFKDLKALQKAKDKAEELFYLDSEMVENSKKMQGILKGLIDKNNS